MKQVTCPRCQQLFDRQTRLDKHLNNSIQYTCNICNKTCCNRNKLEQHKVVEHSEHRQVQRNYQCSACPQSFTELSKLNRHVKSVHGLAKMFKCDKCKKTYNRQDNYNYHIRTCTATINIIPPINTNNDTRPCISGGEIATTSTNTTPPTNRNNTASKRKREKGYAMKMVKNVGRTVSVFRSLFKKTRQQVNTFEKLNEAIDLDVRATIQKHLHEQHKKWYIALKVVFSKAVDPSITTIPAIVFTSNPVHTASAISLDDALAKAKQELVEKIDVFITGGSGWVLESLEGIDLVLRLGNKINRRKS